MTDLSALQSMVKEPSSGLMEQSMSVNVEMEKLMAKALFTMQMVTCIMDNFMMIKRTDLVYTHIRAGKSMKVGGNRTSNMEREKKFYLTDQNLKVDFSMVRRTDMVKIFGKMVQTTKEIGKTMTSMEKEPILGQIKGHIVAAGRKISFMVMGFILGLTEGAILDSM